MNDKANTIKWLVWTIILSLLLCLISPTSAVFAGAEPTEEIITFDLSKGGIEIGQLTNGNREYYGYDSLGAPLTGIHNDSNKYVVMQSNNTTATENRVLITGYLATPIPTFDITISNINSATYENMQDFSINATAYNEAPMAVILRLEGENQVGRVHYSTGSYNDASDSSFTITSAAGDGSTEGSLTAHSAIPWSAAIGGVDNPRINEAARNIFIKGGTINASCYGNNTTGTCAIGGGGNGSSDITISGGIINASNCGTGATIGGGGGYGSEGGVGNVTITGGVVNATNLYSGGVAIGAGGSVSNIGNQSTVIISGGTVTTLGNIGGGSSRNSTGGTVDVTVSGGNVTAHTISGGSGVGGTVTGQLTVTGGSLDIETLPTETVSSNGSEVIVQKAITIPGISEVTPVTDVFITEADNTTPYPYTSEMHTDATGTLYLWIPADCIIQRAVVLVDGEATNISIESSQAVYTIIIPETINMTDDSFGIQCSRSNFTRAHSVTVSCTGDYNLTLTDAPTIGLDYVLYTDADRQNAVSEDGPVATFIGSGTDTAAVYYAVTGTPIYSGEYTDTLTFNINLNSGS